MADHCWRRSKIDHLGMREQTGNPYWHLTPEQLQRYQPKSLNAQREEQEHRSRIAEQERLAKGYVPK